MLKKKFLLAFLALTLITASLIPTAAFADNSFDALIDVSANPDIATPPSIASDATILIEAKSGTILYAKNANEKYYPASITKILTALIIVEKCDLEDIVTFSYRATHDLEEGSSGIARTEGEQMSVKECLYAMLVSSANEVAQALAEHLSGSIEAFADLMNEKAAELGCTNSHFTNPSGLNDSNHYTTCHDMSLIMQAAIKNPKFVEIDSTTTHIVPATNKHSEELSISMAHPLLIGPTRYKYAVCGKTGYTNLAGFTLVTSATKNGMDLICVVLHDTSNEQRGSTSQKLFEYGFNNFKIHNIDEVDPSIKYKAADGNAFLSSNLLSLSVAKDSAIILPSSKTLGELDSEIVLNSTSSSSGYVGRIIYSSNGVPVGQAYLLINKDDKDPYEFLASNTGGETETEDESGMKTARKVFLAAIIIVIAIVIIGFLAYRFINGNSRNRRRRKTSIRKKSFRR